MDENYLDNLLNEVSLDKELDHKIEDELDSQIAKEKERFQRDSEVSMADMFNMDLEQDASISGLEGDLHFSEEQINELDKLDNLADLDIGDLDFSDIDFDDLDMTKLDDLETENLDDLLKDFEGDLEIADSFSQEKQFSDTDMIHNEEAADIDLVEKVLEAKEQDNLNEDTFDTADFLDSLLQESGETDTSKEELLDLDDVLDGFEGKQQTEPEEKSSGEDEETLDDLFSLLDLNEDVEENTEASDQSESIEKSADFDDAEKLSTENAASANKKKDFMQILFGDPDEDDILSEEELAAIAEKKAAKKAEKSAKKQAAKEAKSEKAKAKKLIKEGKRKKEEEARKRVKAQKKAKLKEELANAEPEKALNKPMVIFIFTLFLGGTFLLYLASNNFNYTQAIEKAANYFANQKYRKAYDEIIGVEVKETDQELQERIYTVMYVERLYESYQNNIELGRPEKALDSLLRGVDKYYEHYAEAEQLGVVSDLDYSFDQIKSILEGSYGITVEQAKEINALPDYEYVQMIEYYVNQQTASSQAMEIR